LPGNEGEGHGFDRSKAGQNYLTRSLQLVPPVVMPCKADGAVNWKEKAIPDCRIELSLCVKLQ
jgi:hypothetical protein